MIFDWNHHYEAGGKSAEDDNYREPTRWKHDILNRFYTPGKDTIIDVGCGDLQFWKDDLTPGDKYTGIDISETIAAKNHEKYPNQTFIAASSDHTQNIKADVVICIDMLYHIMDDEVYLKTLGNLKKYAGSTILIYTWRKPPWSIARRVLMALVQFKNTGQIPQDWLTSDGNYQKYRDFLWVAEPLFSPEFHCIGKYNYGTYGAMYVFSRR